jgi:hypothetical protein
VKTFFSAALRLCVNHFSFCDLRESPAPSALNRFCQLKLEFVVMVWVAEGEDWPAAFVATMR